MMYLTIVFIILFSLVTIVYLNPVVKNANNYGPFTVSIDSYGGCKGPKSKNVTIMNTSIDKGTLLGSINFSFLDDAKIYEIKVQVHTLKENKRSFLWNHKLTDPCKHYSFAALIKQYLNATNCVVKTGNYSTEIHFGEVMRSFLGGSFFYGTYSYRSDLTSKKGNIACFNTTLTLKKKIN